jgi:hypothetical protein
MSALPLTAQQLLRVEKICKIDVPWCEAWAWKDRKVFVRQHVGDHAVGWGQKIPQRLHEISLYSDGTTSWIVWLNNHFGWAEKYRRSVIFDDFYQADLTLDLIIYGC